MSVDEGFWDCSMCTYRNPPEAFKCEICDVRKGTSTRFVNPYINFLFLNSNFLASSALMKCLSFWTRFNYKYTFEAFLLFLYRSGRKTRVNPEVVMQQYGQQVFTPPLKKEKKEGGGIGRKSDGAPKKDGDGLRDASTSKENSPKSASTNNKKPKYVYHFHLHLF